MSKKKLVFACPWEKDRLRSWSGTHNALYLSLQNYYDVVDYNTNRQGIHSFLGKVFRKLGMGDMGARRLRSNGKILAKDLAKAHSPILSFEEIPSVGDASRYIYQDLSVCILQDLRDNSPEIFNASGFGSVPRHAMQLREHMQLDYYRKASGIFTMGQWVAQELVDKYGIPTEKVFHVGGYNLDASKIRYDLKEGNKILFVGRDFERKNGPLVVEAFRLLRSKHPDFELYIAGPQNLKLDEPGVHCLGDMNKDELAQYFNLCDVFCMPSKFEAYGLVFVEALIFGLPCIGANRFEMPYFIEDSKTGYLLKSDHAEELADLMEKALQNREMKMTVKNRRDWYAKEYSWETVASRIAAVIG